MEEFNDILDLILREADANPNKNVEDIVRTAMAKLNLDYDKIPEIVEVFNLFDTIDKKSHSLAEARSEGNTRDGWIQDNLEEIANRTGNMGDKIIKGIQDGIQNAYENSLTQKVENDV